MEHALIRTTLIDPVAAVRVRSVINQALRAGSTIRDARSEGRGYLRALCPSLPRQQVSEAVDCILAELDPMFGDLMLCEADRHAPPPPAASVAQLSLGL
ncbi:hypothetical protein BKE38_06850 [Pseudoroseomonas deserti]|uniref:Uncharacterized protein n=1 Tax=Teichococcus deserti TaxID=1817963 RepID=A0A1V2H6W4_9PROT|nr:hypothetical protein [Pseudoroseomonas deserti]ONG56043.1 hypothetical protein BKE38_06850 [Pseudoroseomonas deserti]